MLSFQALGLSTTVLKGIVAAGYTTPTPIQTAAIPRVLAGADLIGSAQTGTGKTAAFVLPLLDRLLANPPQGNNRPVRALVVTPTRELALQVEAAVRAYGQGTGLRSLTIFGGVGFGPQLDGLRRGADIVVATPGRLLDHLERGSLRLDRVQTLILDEADRMFDMGFLPAVKRIVAAVPAQRQTLLFSATMPPEIEALASKILTRPETITIGQRTNPAATVTQRVAFVDGADKLDALVQLLRTEGGNSAIVFTRTKHRADRVSKKLTQMGIAAGVLHGGRSQPQREKALDAFRAGRVPVLVATDIAARGIDVVGLALVVNFDVPNVPEDYIHRIGRTGRADASGLAVSLASLEESDEWRAIERHVGRAIERMDMGGLSLSAVDVRAFEAPAPRTSTRSNANGRRRTRSRVAA